MNGNSDRLSVMPGSDIESPGPAMSYEALKQFRLIFRAVQQHSQWVEQRCGLTSAQLWAIAELAHRPGQRVSDLAAAMLIHPSTASNLLDKLEKRGYVSKERHHRDQRVVRLTLTAKALETLAKAPQPAKGILQTALFNLPAAVLRSLVNDLDALVAAMNIQDDRAALEPLSPHAEKQELESGVLTVDGLAARTGDE